MPFEKGQSGNPGGKPDKRKTKAQIAITQLVDKHSQHLDKWLEEIYEAEGPRAAYGEFVRVLEFALPKLARKELAGGLDLNTQGISDAELDAKIAALTGKDDGANA